MNIHGDRIDLETGQTRIRGWTANFDAMSTSYNMMSIEALYPAMRLIHVFLDNARYHHAKLVRDWLAQPERRIKLHFVPPYCPHLNTLS